MTYPDVDDLKVYVKTASGSEDALLQWILDGVIAFVEKWTGHDFVGQALQTKYVDPCYPALLNNKRVLLLKEFDLVAVTGIENGDGAALAASDYRLLPLSGPPYWKIELLTPGLIWTRGSSNDGIVTIEGTTGFSTNCPKDIFLAILELCAHEYRARSTGGMGSVATATRQGLIIQPSGVPKNVLDKLELYRRHGG